MMTYANKKDVTFTRKCVNVTYIYRIGRKVCYRYSAITRQQLLLISLYVMTLGVAICVRSAVGSSVISTLPYVFEQTGCTILGFGIAMEVRCGSVTMPDEGMPIAITRVTGQESRQVKIMIDISLVCLAIFFGSWQWHITGVGTLFAIVCVGMAVRTAGKHMAWYEHMLNYQHGFRRYIYGLARYIRR